MNNNMVSTLIRKMHFDVEDKQSIMLKLNNGEFVNMLLVDCTPSPFYKIYY